MKLEWDEQKNRKSFAKHGITFDVAARVFLSDYIEIPDDAHTGYNQYGEWEERFTAIGWVEDVLYVVYTVREHDNEDYIRMISARLAMESERELYFSWLHGRGV